jgi:hypothetical protein
MNTHDLVKKKKPGGGFLTSTSRYLPRPHANRVEGGRTTVPRREECFGGAMGKGEAKQVPLMMVRARLRYRERHISCRHGEEEEPDLVRAKAQYHLSMQGGTPGSILYQDM